MRPAHPVLQALVAAVVCAALPPSAVAQDGGRFVPLTTGDPGRLWEELRDTVREAGLARTAALAITTSSPARLLGLERMGRLTVALDADLPLVDDEWQRKAVIAGGAVRLEPTSDP